VPLAPIIDLVIRVAQWHLKGSDPHIREDIAIFAFLCTCNLSFVV